MQQLRWWVVSQLVVGQAIVVQVVVAVVQGEVAVEDRLLPANLGEGQVG